MLKQERESKLQIALEKKEKRFQNKMTELAQRDPRFEYRNSKIDLAARKRVKAHRDYELSQKLQKNIIHTFQKQYDAEVEKHAEQEEARKEEERTNELKEQVKRRMSLANDTKSAEKIATLDQSQESSLPAGLNDSGPLERLDRQDSLKFLLRLKREQNEAVAMPRQFHYSIESGLKEIERDRTMERTRTIEGSDSWLYMQDDEPVLKEHLRPRSTLDVTKAIELGAEIQTNEFKNNEI